MRYKEISLNRTGTGSFTKPGKAETTILAQFIHPELNRQVEFFGGSYLLLEEGIAYFQGKEVLYLVGIAGLDASCCGRGGCAFIKVPGFIQAGKGRKDESGHFVSDVSSITEKEIQEEITQILKEKYPEVTQVEFL